MPRPLVFLLGDQELALNLIKVERSKLYGFKDVEAVDEEDAVCDLATLADDGRTLIGRGGTGIGWLDADGKWCEKADLRPVDIHGDPIIPVESSFGQPIKLFDTATPQDLLDCNVRLVYCLEPVDESSSLEDLNAELKKGTIFCFPVQLSRGTVCRRGIPAAQCGRKGHADHWRPDAE